MSLSARDRRALDSIRDQLNGSDPHLAGLLGTFARLTAGEEMPSRERIRARWRSGAGHRPRHRRTSRLGSSGRGFGGLGLGGAVTLLWLLVTVTMITVAIVLSTSSADVRCQASWTVACADPAPGATSHSGQP